MNGVNSYQLSPIRLALIPLLLYTAQGLAQTGKFILTGETVRFEVNSVPGILYCWKVKENNDQESGAETDKATYLTTRCNPSVLIKWPTAGTFFLTVTGSDENGCSNSKAIRVIVSDRHIPVAVDDYAMTNWAKDVRIDLLSNDFDAGNDLDPSSLKILTKPELGEIAIGEKGFITYSPVRKIRGTDRFYYRICDLCNQCDTARVTVNLTDPPLYIPTGISPNGDGVNDRFVINGLAAYPKSSLTIFSRDGNLIYHSENYQNDWSGSQNNRKSDFLRVPTGTYYYVLHLGGTSRVIRGFIFLAQ